MFDVDRSSNCLITFDHFSQPNKPILDIGKLLFARMQWQSPFSSGPLSPAPNLVEISGTHSGSGFPPAVRPVQNLDASNENGSFGQNTRSYEPALRCARPAALRRRVAKPDRRGWQLSSATVRDRDLYHRFVRRDFC